MVHEKKALTDGVLANLFWKLRLRLEADGNQGIDIHRLRKEREYRDHWLNHAAAAADDELKSLSTAINKRIQQLDSDDDSPMNQEQPRNQRKLLWLGAAALLLITAGLLFLFVTPTPAPTVHTPAAIAPPATALDKKPDQPVVQAPTQTLFRIHGSNTVGEELAPALVKDYLADLGAINIQTQASETPLESTIEAELDGKRVAVEIHAHGSSTAFSDLEAGVTDIGMASRRIKSEEVEKLLPGSGDLSTVEAEHVIALDGLAVVVNPALPVRELDVATLAKVFSGEISNWSALNGPDQDIQLFARDDLSGTWDSFNSMVLKPQGLTLAESARRFESSQDLSDGVASTPGAIGFIGLPYVRDAKLLAISGGESALALFPNNFTVSTEDYTLARRLYLYLPPKSSNAEIRKFVDHVHARQGQNIVGEIGFISQNISTTKPPLTDDLPYKYLELTEKAQRLSVNVRFAPGSENIDNKAQRDLYRLANYLEANPERRILLFGFTDSVGNEQINLNLSKTRADLVSKELMKFGIVPYKVEGFGDAGPVASNENEEGRQRNRRVEVWII